MTASATGTWVHGRVVLQGNAACIHSVPASDQDMGHPAEISSALPSDLAAATSSCFGLCAHTDTLKLGISCDEGWVAGMTRASRYVRCTSLAMQPIHPIRKKLHAGTATRFSQGDLELVVGGYRVQGWDGRVPSVFPTFLAPAPLAFILEDVYRLHTEITTSPAYGLTKHHATPCKHDDRFLFHAVTMAQTVEFKRNAIHRQLESLAVLLQMEGSPPGDVSEDEVVRISDVPPDRHMAILLPGVHMKRGFVLVWQLRRGPKWAQEFVIAVEG